MMARRGRLVTLGTVHVLLLLLTCLVLSSRFPVGAATHDSLFVPSSYTWQDSHFSLISVNKSLIIQINMIEHKIQALQWPDSVIELPKGDSFSGFLYFRDTNPGLVTFQFLPFRWLTTYEIVENYDHTDYCISINLHDGMLKTALGYKGEDLLPPCLQCKSWMCPMSTEPCECGYYVIQRDPTKKFGQIQRRFMGVKWRVVDKKIDDAKTILP